MCIRDSKQIQAVAANPPIFLLIGLIGAVIPVIPGPFISFVAVVLLYATSDLNITTKMVWILGVFMLSRLGNKLEEYFIMDPYVDILTALIATILLIFFGAIAGYIPAKRAASIKPIVALRDE